MEREQQIVFYNPRGDRLSGVVHHPAGRPTAAAALLCHGMESDKESEKIVALSRKLAARGTLALRFDFSYAGESSGRFEDLTYSGEVDDLASAFHLIRSYPVAKIGVLGSSMGGTVALLFAARERSLAAVATIAAPVHPEKITENLLTPSEVARWRRDGFLFYHGRRINVSLLDDLERLDVASEVKKITCPVLVVHGDRDDTVPATEAEELYRLLPGPKRLLLVRGADHRFSDPSHLERALAASLEWFSRYLERGEDGA